MEVQQRINSMVSWVAKVPPTYICATTSLESDLFLDPIDVLSLILKLERWFDVALTKEEVEQIETVKDIYDCISRYTTKYAA